MKVYLFWVNDRVQDVFISERTAIEAMQKFMLTHDTGDQPWTSGRHSDGKRFWCTNYARVEIEAREVR